MCGRWRLPRASKSDCGLPRVRDQGGRKKIKGGGDLARGTDHAQV